jgi:hypothetical protein
MYTWIPRDVLEGLAVTPDEDWPFVLADGREVRAKPLSPGYLPRIFGAR